MNRNDSEKWTKRLVRWVEGESVSQGDTYVKKPFSPHKKRRSEEELGDDRRIGEFEHVYRSIAVLVCLCIVVALLYTVFNLPLFGAEDAPASNEVVERYVEKGLEETGAVNIVAGMILDYRAFDTFGESSVLYLAVSCVMMLLLRDKNNIIPEEDIATAHEMEIERETRDPILQTIINVLMPCILLFGVYVVLNGHLSPGGGFSGGAIMGAGLIVYGASFGTQKVQTFFNMKLFRALTTTALLCYAASKAYAFFTGANGIESIIPLGTPGALLSSGLIFVLDVCVGLVVACTMYGFYALFSRGEL